MYKKAGYETPERSKSEEIDVVESPPKMTMLKLLRRNEIGRILWHTRARILYGVQIEN